MCRPAPRLLVWASLALVSLTAFGIERARIQIPLSEADGVRVVNAAAELVLGAGGGEDVGPGRPEVASRCLVEPTCVAGHGVGIQGQAPA